VDEVGRGSLAGSVVAAAYRFHRSGTLVPGLDDSKKLTLKKREELFTILTKPEMGFWALGEATIEEIEEHNILVASQMAMGRALDKLGLNDGVILVDGLPAKHLGRKHIAVVRGDGICPSIAAASILGKVSRDRNFLHFGQLYPTYGFTKNRGYGTAEHLRALAMDGPCPIHRRSFLPLGSASVPRVEK
jgi:ribonuclease HII